MLPVRDGERFLADAIESVLAQTFAGFELIVIDDGSRDRTAALVERFVRRDGRVRLVRRDPAGTSEAMNHGCNLARGDYVARLDADDVALPHRLERQVAYLDEEPGVGAVGGAAVFIRADGSPFATVRYPTSDAEIRATIARSCPFVHSAVTVRKSALVEVGGYRGVCWPADDWDLWLRLTERWRLANLADPVVRYRIHPRQASLASIDGVVRGSLLARAAARARYEGHADPFYPGETPDGLVERLGIGADQVEAAWAEYAVWLAKTSARAGYRATAASLLRDARDRVGDSQRLLAEIDDADAVIAAEQGRRRLWRLLPGLRDRLRRGQ